MKLYPVGERLYVSGYPRPTARTFRNLQDAGVDAIVCVAKRRTPESVVEEMQRWDHLHVPDTHREFPVDRFRQIVSLILEELAAGRTVLVHCMEGRNRSMTAALLAERARQGWTGEQAYQHGKALRGNSLYNERFAEFLRNLP